MPASPSSPEFPLVDAVGRVHQPARERPRIVSLVPSLTELLCDLGLAELLVGRTGFCIHPREQLRSVSKVGGTKDVRVDTIRELAPSHLVVNIDENRRETVEELAAFVPSVIVTHPCTPQDNIGIYRLFGGIFGCTAEAHRLVGELETALAEARACGEALPPETVLYLIWREPWMTVSRETYIAAMLALVGWRCAASPSSNRYPAFAWGEDWLAPVARVFLSTEPYRFRERHIDEVVALSGVPARLIDGKMVSWYGSRAIAGLRYLVALRRTLAQQAGAAARAR